MTFYNSESEMVALSNAPRLHHMAQRQSQGCVIEGFVWLSIV